jgi:hypothetical protein
VARGDRVGERVALSRVEIRRAQLVARGRAHGGGVRGSRQRETGAVALRSPIRSSAGRSSFSRSGSGRA